MKRAIAVTLAGIPLAVAVFGPVPAQFTNDRRGPAYAFGPGYPLGTDGLGRDVLGLVLRGGVSTLALAAAATVAAYGIGTLVGLLAAGTRRRRLDETLMRPLDVLL